MTHESEQNASSEAAASSIPVPEKKTPAQSAPGSAAERLAKMPPDELKKAYRDARDLQDILGGITAMTALFFLSVGVPLAFILLAGVMLKSPNNLILLPFYLTVAVSLICVFLTFWSYRFTFAKWVIRIWMFALSVFSAIALIYTVSRCFFTVENGRVMLLEPSQIVWNVLYKSGPILFLSAGLFGLIFALRAFSITFNPNLFGPDRFSDFQIRFAWKKREAGQPLDSIPPWDDPVEPGFKEKLITGIAAFGLVYLPAAVWWFVSSLLKGRLPF